MASDPGTASNPGMATGPATRTAEARAIEHPEPDPGRRALEALDRVLGEKPGSGTTKQGRERLGLDFSETTRLICGYRDILIQAQRQQGATPHSRAVLQEVNSVLSAVLGGHFPLGDIPWPQVEQARDAFARLLARD